MSGRNNISWEDKLAYDLEYIENITFLGDIKIIFMSVWKAFVKQADIETDGMATAEDMGDYLLRTGKINEALFNARQEEAKELLVM